MDHPFRGQGGLFLLLLSYLAGFFLALAAGPAGGAVSGLLLAASAFLVALRLRAFAVASVVAALCGTLAAGRIPYVDPALVAPYLEAEVVLEGKVSGIRATDSGWAGTAEEAVVSLPGAQGAQTLGTVLLYIRNPDRQVSFPALLRASGRLRKAGGRGNPGEIPSEWNAMSQGARYAFFADASKAVFLPGAGDGRIARLFADARRRTGEWLLRNCGPTDGALYMLSLATGEAPPHSHPMVELLRKTGLAHLLAISGVNVAVFHIIAAFLIRTAVWAVRRRHGTPDLGLVSSVLSLPACWMYVLLAGAPVPAVRSAGMITLTVLAWRRYGTRAAGAAWSAMLILTLVRSPLEMFSPSFLLSYGATFFLIANCAVPPADRRDGWRVRAGQWVREAVRASSVAFLGTLPVSAAFFQSVPSGAILWNLLFGPVLGTAGVAGACLAVAGGVFGIDALGPPVRLVTGGLTGALSLLDAVSGSGAGCFPVPPSGVAAPFAAVAAGAAGTVFLARPGRGKAWIAPAAASVLFLAWIHLPYLALPERELRLTALDVGNGSATLVSFPGGGHALIDAGSALRGNAGERAVLPYLRKRGIRKIDMLVLSHAHEDHYGGAAAVLSSVEVGEIWLPEGEPKEAFGRAVSSWPGRVRAVRTGDRAVFGGAELAVRSSGPMRDDAPANDRGTVLEVRYRLLSVWLPGDVERGPSAWGGHDSVPGQRRVLFLPHHGSPKADPQGWAANCLPEAIVSQNSDCFTGENLLPSPQRFLLKNGAITLRSDGKSLFFMREGSNRGWKLLWRLA